jgi:mono/diheme cytochrome c family protein
MSSRHSLRSLLLLCAVGALAACTHSGSSSAGAVATPAGHPSPSATVAGLPAGVTAQMVAVGDSIFHKGSCQRCHGMDAKGTDRGPDLTDDKWAQISGSYADIVSIVTSGVPKDKVKMAGAPFGMRARGGINLTDDQVKEVAAYVYTVSRR